MNIPKYEVTYSPSNEFYTFVSVGKKGRIIKAVQIQEFQVNLFNLGFGDLDIITNEVNDKVKSDNGDTEIVLATVISIAIEFLQKNPSAYIYFEGNSDSRNRLYQMAINLYYEEFIQHIAIFGYFNDGSMEEYQKDKKYESFLIRKVF